jgi:ornithine cyclodeaminase/alanine dehydrogenase-like protein (mu-crystallin family)
LLFAPALAAIGTLGQHHEGLVTATSSRAPLIALREVRLGTHITAIGADGPRKLELDPAVTRGARVTADDPSQAARVG